MQVEYKNPVYYTHDNITRGALEKVAAIYIATVLRPDQFDLSSQNDSEIIKQYFAEVKSASGKFDTAVGEIIEGIGIAMGESHTSAKYTMNNEMIAEGNSHLNTIRNQIVSLSRESQPDWTAIRMMVGKYLFTLQDFYSNTNWIELGHGTLESLGWNETLDIPVAGYYQSTCKDCPNGNTNITCHGNLINNGNVLTSGYIDLSTNSSGGVKPYSPNWPTGEGKCSHGGSEDISRLIPAIGGINKETIFPQLSPHYYLHSKAGLTAIDATTQFFVQNETSLLTVLGNLRLGKLLGLDEETHQSLCVNCNDPASSVVFVIDTTGSMANDIFQVRQKAVEIVTKSMIPGFTPANYILVTFNDPASLTTYQVTKHGSEFKHWLDALTVHGGDDCPEYAMSGLKTAMENALNGSCVFFFTDADPKDPELFSDVQRLITTKDLHLISFITGQCDGNLNATGGADIGCISKSHQTRKRRGWGNLFQALGGTYIPVKDRDISKPLDKILETNMAIKYVNNFTAIFSHGSLEIIVDSRITAFTIEIKGASSSPQNALKRPDGSTETFADKSSFNDIGRNTYIMSVVHPATGKWNLENPNTGIWSISVKQQGDIEFSYTFFHEEHKALLPVHGSTITGSTLTLLVKVTGLLDDDSLLFAVLLDEYRNEIGRLNLTESKQGMKRIGTTLFTVPNQTFRVAVEGLEKGNVFRRESIETLYPTSASIRFLENEGHIYADKDTTVTCKIVNSGSTTETYQVQFTDSAGFVKSSFATTTVTVDAGSSKLVMVELRAKIIPKTTSLTVRLFIHGNEIQKDQKILMVL